MAPAMKEEIFEIKLTSEHCYQGLRIPKACLPEFGIGPEELQVAVQVKDEAGVWWSFELATRSNNYNPRGVIACENWRKFLQRNHLREGDIVTFSKIKKQAKGECVGYEVKLKAAGAIRVFGAIFGRQ